MILENLTLITLFIFLYCTNSAWIERSPINGALVFVLFGMLFGPLGLGLLNMRDSAEGLRIIAEITLAVVLFTDAANANLGVLRKAIDLPQRLLLIGLPLTLFLGFGAAMLLIGGLSILEALILSTMLAPTDAALGKAVVSDKGVPARIRESLNAESGLNDGICVPVLFLLVALEVGVGIEHGPARLAIHLVAEEVGIGLAVAVVIGVSGSWLLRTAHRNNWVTESWQQLPVVALAVVSFGLAQVLGGSGFIAAFVGGLIFGHFTKENKHVLILSAESTGDTLSLFTWVVFGAAVVGQVIGAFTWQVVVYAILSLTVIRMLPVFLSLIGSGLGNGEKLFVGWFGPRGLASIVFAIIVLEKHLPNGDIMILTVICTVMFSILLHGLSAKPLIRALGTGSHTSKHSE